MTHGPTVMFIQFANITTGTWLGVLLLGVPSAALCLWGASRWLHLAAPRLKLSRRIEADFDAMRFCLFVLLPTLFIWIGLLSELPWWLMFVLYSCSIAVAGIAYMVVVLITEKAQRTG